MVYTEQATGIREEAFVNAENEFIGEGSDEEDAFDDQDAAVNADDAGLRMVGFL